MIVHGIYILVYLVVYREPDVSSVMECKSDSVFKRLGVTVKGGGIEPRQNIHVPRNVIVEIDL